MGFIGDVPNEDLVLDSCDPFLAAILRIDIERVTLASRTVLDVKGVDRPLHNKDEQSQLGVSLRMPLVIFTGRGRDRGLEDKREDKRCI